MKSTRYPEIDLLRGIACLMVVAFHYLHRGQASGRLSEGAVPWLDTIAGFGYLGVHLFFMISGYVIYMSAEGASLRGFFASRVSRLYPVLWAGVVLTALVTWLAASPHFSVSVPQVLANLTMVPHWMGVAYVDGAYWSLAVELQFYLLMAALIALRWLPQAEFVMAAWLLVGTVNVVRPMYPVEFWLIAQWASLFVAGMLFYRVTREGWTARRLGLMVWALALTLAYAARATWLPAAGAEPAAPGWMGFGITAALLLLFHLVFLGVSRGWISMQSSSICVWMGILTYPVYIIHQNIGYILLEAAGWRALDFHVRALTVLIGVVAAAWAVNRWIERPLSRWLKARLAPR